MNIQADSTDLTIQRFNDLHVVRLQKFLADAGVASRRAAEQFILDGRVRVNGKIRPPAGNEN